MEKKGVDAWAVLELGAPKGRAEGLWEVDLAGGPASIYSSKGGVGFGRMEGGNDRWVHVWTSREKKRAGYLGLHEKALLTRPLIDIISGNKFSDTLEHDLTTPLSECSA